MVHTCSSIFSLIYKITIYCWDVFSETFVFEILLEIITFILNLVLDFIFGRLFVFRPGEMTLMLAGISDTSVHFAPGGLPLTFEKASFSCL